MAAGSVIFIHLLQECVGGSVMKLVDVELILLLVSKIKCSSFTDVIVGFLYSAV